MDIGTMRSEIFPSRFEISYCGSEKIYVDERRTRGMLEDMGLKVKGLDSDDYCFVDFPDGWKKKVTSNAITCNNYYDSSGKLRLTTALDLSSNMEHFLVIVHNF